ncbi:MAG: OmpP1/FadL family transporter [Gammaproteobacteria bacterium]
MKKIRLVSTAVSAISLFMLSLCWGVAQAGPHGSEFDLTLTPAAGGMEGVGIARPQDPIAMLFANPSSLTQLKGSNAFIIGGTFADPGLQASAAGPTSLIEGVPASMAPLTGPFNGSSRETELVAPHAAAIHRITPRLVAGIGLTGVSGLGSDFRDVTNAPNLVADLALFGGNMVAAYQVTDWLSVGGAITVGIASLNAGLTETTANVHELGLGGSVGATVEYGPVVVGLAYKEELSINYQNVIETAPDVFSAIELEQPREVQFGIATSEGLLKNTVIELDFRYKNWDDANGYNSFWKDQYILSSGIQHKLATPIGNVYLRTGYTFNTKIGKNSSDIKPFDSFGKVTLVKNPMFSPALPPGPTNPPSIPVTRPFLQLAQATIADGHWQQSVSIGLGYDIPTTNIRLDVNTSYAFDGEANFGPFHNDGTLFTAGMGLTWQF